MLSHELIRPVPHLRFLALAVLAALGAATALVGPALVTPVWADTGARESRVVHALFDLDTPAGGPFPTDRFTVADASQNTRRRVNLPKPDCDQRRSDCEDLDVINTLDGYNLRPRLSVPFDGPIDVSSVNRSTVLLINLGSTLDESDGGGQVVGINQIVWDPDTNTLHAKSDELLDQHARFAVIVTNRLRDVEGQPVEASEAFRRFRHEVRGEYKHALLEAIHAARRLGIWERDIVTASVFTTQSVTAVLEKMRDTVKAMPPPEADFNLGPDGTRTVFPLADVTSITWSQHTRYSPRDEFVAVPLARELALLRDLIPGAVGWIAYGKYTSPEYLVHPGEFIPPVATRTGTPQIQSTMDIYFNVVLPSGSMPPNGWPVAIYGTGANGTKDTWLPRVATSMAARGIATVSINFYASGFGPLSSLTVERAFGGPVTFLSGGRTIDQNGNGEYESLEGFEAVPPLVAIRDAYRQTVIDWVQLVRTIQAGVDVDGDGAQDLDPSRIYQFGNSTGGVMGTVFMAVEPSVRAGVFNAAGGSIVEWSRLSGVTGRVREGLALARREPPLLNSPGISILDGVPISGPFFFENIPPRDGLPLRVGLEDGTSVVIQSPVINSVNGAMEIQEVLDKKEWVMQAGDPLAYAPHVRKSPLDGVPQKSVIVQFGKGDRNTPNPTVTALLRAGELADRATFYRHDLAFAEIPGLDRNPHQFLIRVDDPALPIALGYQSQIAAFFESDGNEIIHPEPARFFEVPIILPLPEDLNYIP